MYRVFLVIVLSAVAQAASTGFKNDKHRCKFGEPCDDVKKYLDMMFTTSSGVLAKAEEYLEKFCHAHLEKDETKKIYESDAFKLITPLDGFKEDDIEIKIRHRAIFIHAEHEKEPKKYDLVTILPEIADAEKASWSLENGKLHVTFPYKVEFNKEIPLLCKEDIPDEVKRILKKH